MHVESGRSPGSLAATDRILSQCTAKARAAQKKSAMCLCNCFLDDLHREHSTHKIWYKIRRR